MRYTAIIILCVALACSCSRSSTTSQQESDSAAVARAMLEDDDYDSAAQKDTTKRKKEDLPPRYVCNTSNEAIELMNTLPGAECYRQGILPRMSQECLDYAMRLINSDQDGFLIVDKETMQVALFDRYGRERFRTGIACGSGLGNKRGKGDCRTPEGFFSVQGIYDSTDWLYRDDNGRVSKVKGQFGPRFIRLSIPGTSQIGIHGTRAPGSIGRRASHGCIRVTNDNIMKLVGMVHAGMPVIVSPSRRDERVNSREGRRVPWVSLSPGAAPRTPLPPEPSRPHTALSDTTLQYSQPVDTVAARAASPVAPEVSAHLDSVK